MPKQTMHVELVKGRLRWFYRIVSNNGNKLVTSQKYFSKSNAKRAAVKTANTLDVKLVITK